MSRRKLKIAVIGGGAFGTALACVAARAGHECLIYLRDVQVAHAINSDHQNPIRLPGINLPKSITATIDAEQLQSREIILFAVPAQQLRPTLGELAPHLKQASHVIACAKGLEHASGLYQHQILSKYFPQEIILALSGPSFAIDIARELPTALTIAADNIENADRIAKLLSTPSFRLYSSDDLIGVETGGALKNVLAIAVGIVRGMELGASAEAALFARGFAELQRLGMGMGARPHTLSGLSGLGDLVLTCSSPQSRNFAYGVALGKSASLEKLPLAEGIYTAGIAANLAKKLEIDAPIISAVASILDETVTPKQAMAQLLARPLRNESS